MTVARARVGALVIAAAFSLTSVRTSAAPSASSGAIETSIVAPAVGGVAWTSDGIAQLGTDLDAMLAADPALRGAHYGVYAIDTGNGNVLYRHAADDEFQPASTLKLLVGSSALEKLSPQFQFHTELRIRRGPVSVLSIVAGGDPFLTTDDLASAARAIANDPGAQAPSTVLPAISVDASHFDDAPYPTGWTWDDFGQAYAPRVSAAALEENLVHLIVTPAAQRDDDAVVRTRSIARVLSSKEMTSASEGDRPVTCARRSPPYAPPVAIGRATTGAASSADTLDVSLATDGCIDVVGSIPLGAQPEDLDAAVPDPVAYLAAAAHGTLRNAGVRFAAPGPGVGSRRQSADVAENGEAARVWSHESEPLRTFLGPRFWIPSDNLVGELLLKELGFATAGKPGTTLSGVAYEKLWLHSIGVDPATVTLADGCGMSQYDRITPRDLVTILQHDWQGPNRQVILDSLPIGGARGTIEGIAGTAAAGRVFAKTGSMMHVRGLAGFLATMRHGAVTFAFNVDDWNGDYPALAALRARVLARIVTD